MKAVSLNKSSELIYYIPHTVESSGFSDELTLVNPLPLELTGSRRSWTVGTPLSYKYVYMTNCTIVPREQTLTQSRCSSQGFQGSWRLERVYRREDEATDEKDSWNWARLCNQEQFIGTGERLRSNSKDLYSLGHDSELPRTQWQFWKHEHIPSLVVQYLMEKRKNTATWCVPSPVKTHIHKHVGLKKLVDLTNTQHSREILLFIENVPTQRIIFI